MSQSFLSSGDRVFREETLEAYQLGVERAISVMYDRLGEELTVDDLADAAFMSRFHFSRVFARITGVSAARFLAAVRMQEAKRLLLKTDGSVTDICFDVGYNSLGTFTRTFANLVGLPPTAYRNHSRRLLQYRFEDALQNVPCCNREHSHATFAGAISFDAPLAITVIAIFPTAILQTRPIDYVCVTHSLRFSFHRQAPQDARILAIGLRQGATMKDALLLTDQYTRVATVHCSEANPLAIRLALQPCSKTSPQFSWRFLFCWDCRRPTSKWALPEKPQPSTSNRIIAISFHYFRRSTSDGRRLATNWAGTS